MGAAATHLVARQTLELRVGSEDQARELSGGIPALLERRLAPLLQELFDGLAPGGRHLRFGRIELDLGHIPSADLEAELPGRLREGQGVGPQRLDDAAVGSFQNF